VSEFAVVIPARYASVRLPGKPLLPIAGKPMLEHVWHRACESGAAEVVIATDDERIAEAAAGFSADVCLTDAAHTSGTERIAEVAAARGWEDRRVVVNLQGDEPLMPPALLSQCAGLLDDRKANVGTLASPLRDPVLLNDPNAVKVVVNAEGFALYFSRAPIPFSRDAGTDSLAAETALIHHGIYAYRCADLRRMVAAPPADIERAERLEQLRALYLGMSIKVGIPDAPPGPGVDTEQDLDRVARLVGEG